MSYHAELHAFLASLAEPDGDEAPAPTHRLAPRGVSMTWLYVAPDRDGPAGTPANLPARAPIAPATASRLPALELAHV